MHLETRLLIVAEMLDKAVAEVRRAMAEIKADNLTDVAPEPPTPDTPNVGSSADA
jgi:hypothetical protein